MKIAQYGTLALRTIQPLEKAYQAFDENGNLNNETQQMSILQLGSKLATMTAKLNLSA